MLRPQHAIHQYGAAKMQRVPWACGGFCRGQKLRTRTTTNQVRVNI